MMASDVKTSDADAVQFHKQTTRDDRAYIPCRPETKEQIERLRDWMNEGLENVTFTYDDTLRALLEVVQRVDAGQSFSWEDGESYEKAILVNVLCASAAARDDLPDNPQNYLPDGLFTE